MTGEWILKMQFTHTMEYYSALKKEGSPAVCENMEEPGGHYAKGNKPATEEQTLSDFTYT